MNQLPHAQGLYDPAHEHDACGIGFIANIQGKPSHDIVLKGLEILQNLAHRGASGCDAETGDGAGVLIQIPHAFFSREAEKLGFKLPDPGQYGIAMCFLPVEPQQRLACEAILEKTTRDEGLAVFGWRDTPVQSDAIGRVARVSQPYIQQFFVSRPAGLSDDEFERKLFVIRKIAEKQVLESPIRDKSFFYIPSFSSRTIIYKGLLLAHQIGQFYNELLDPETVSAVCLVHQRFSTNTFPTWQLAHPFRYICHNGEINTVRGNVNWMNARQPVMRSPLFDVQKLGNLIQIGGSDSAALDNAVELYTMAGRSLPHVMAMLIPEAWDADTTMPRAKKDFYEYHASLTEPWDGPAAVAFTDGRIVGATLDRNGLRPARYLITKDGLIVMASESGVLPFQPQEIEFKGRLQPGRMLLVDLAQGRIVPDDEIKGELAARQPYGDWLRQNQINLDELPNPSRMQLSDHATVLNRQRCFGYTDEDVRTLIAPMIVDEAEPVGSMGVDTPLACLSDKPQSLFNYFKQLFAQVTNPPIDPIREELVMSLTSYIGVEGETLLEVPENCHTLKMPHPILSNRQLEKLRRVSRGDLLASTLSATFNAHDGELGLKRALDGLCRRASLAIKSGYTLLILSDRGIDEEYAPIPSLLALTAVHNHLVREGTRMGVAVIVESGEPREVMHFSLLIGYGASAVNPYLAIETIEDLASGGELPAPFTPEIAVKNYISAIKKGLLKVFSKMGISTLQSYRGAQTFEAIGLNKDLVNRYFTGTSSRIEGVGLDVLAAEAVQKHSFAFRSISSNEPELAIGGNYQYRINGERHLLTPESVMKMQHAVRRGSFSTFQEYSRIIDTQNEALCTLRGLMRLKTIPRPLPLDEVEPASEIVKRFATGAMSFGSISKEAHETLAIAMNRIGGRSNTGEGGEDEARYHPLANGDSKRSAIKQVASGRFGVTTSYLVNADELQIKVAQGAKPGEGGQLPGHKVDVEIARVRHSIPGVGLVSPPPHHDIYSIEDLAQLIYDLKNVNPAARVSVKLVAEVGVGTVAAGVSKAHADLVLISGYDGGTGASPLSSLRHAGSPWELGLSETQQVLVMNDLRSRIRVQVDGKLQTGRDVVIAALLGAEEFGFSTAPLIAMGCIMMRKCHLNTCPVGIATQNPTLRKKFEGTPENVINFLFFVAEEVRLWMAQLGFRRLDEMIGRVDMIEMRPAVEHWKARGLDFSSILYNPQVPGRISRRCTTKQDHALAEALDNSIIKQVQPALEKGESVNVQSEIRNVHRTVGAMLSGEVTRRYGAGGLPDNTIRLQFTGSAGQSFGAFVCRGMTLSLEGDANDYVGKGLSGGRIVVYPPRSATFAPEKNILIGNTVLYGATSGEAYFSGIAGERFAVRNSGVTAVVEGVGDHACEYMTNGIVVVLGPTGRNFAAGMSGGTAYVYDPASTFRNHRCNPLGVELQPVMEQSDLFLLESLIRKHLAATKSPLAARLLDKWSETVPSFVKVLPLEYKAILEKQKSSIEGAGIIPDVVRQPAMAIGEAAR